MGKVGRFLGGAAAVAAGILLSPVTGGASLALVGVGLNMATRQLFGPTGLNTKLSALRQTVAETSASLPVIYGQAKVGVKLVDIRVDPAATTKLSIVAAICHGSSAGLGIQSIGKIWFNEKLAFDAAGTLQSAFKKGATPYATVTKYLGTQSQAVDSGLASRFASQWTSQHRGRGVAYLVFELTFEPDIYQAIPAITVEVQGAQVLDPRQASLTYSYLTTPPLEVLDYLLNTVYGWGAGRRTPLDAAAVTHSGMTVFSASGTVDGDPATNGWNTNSASTGAYLQFDFGTARELDRVDIWVERGGSSPGTYQVQYADAAAGPYTTVAGLTCAPTLEYRNVFRWASNNSGSHRYWRLRLSNTPGAGSNLTGAEWWETEVDYASFATGANDCDTTTSVPPADSAYKAVVSVPALTPIKLQITGHGWSTGNRVSLELTNGASASGITDGVGAIEGRTFTVTVVDANNVTLDGTTGSGSYTASSLRAGKLVTEPLYAGNGALSTDDSPQDILRQILSSCRGRLIYQNGRYRFHQRNGAQSASIAFTDTDVRAVRYITPGTKEKYNAVRASFVDQAKDYAAGQRDFPRAGVPNTYLVADNGYPSVLEMELPMVYSPYQADRIAQVTLRESRDGISLQATMAERALLAQVGDVANITLDTPGFGAKPFWVESVLIDAASAQPSLALQEYEPNAYVLDDAQLVSSIPNTNLPDGTAPPSAPAGLVLAAGDSEMLLQPNGEAICRIKLTGFASTDPYLDHYEVQAKRSTESAFDVYGHPLRTDTVFWIYPVNIGESWDVQIRSFNTVGIASAWVSASVTVAPTTTPQPLGVVDWFDDYPGSRWSNTGTGGSSAVAVSPDSKYGGKVLVLTANRTGEWIPYIPFDRTKLYAIRARFRVLKGATSPNNDFFLGFKAYDGAQQQLAANGAGSGATSDLFACGANFLNVAAGLGWTEVVGYIRGWNGDWYAPPASALTNSGFGNYTAANVGDGLVLNTAFESDAASSGATLTIDLGVGVTKAFVRAKVYLDGGSGVAQYKLQYSDNASSWTDISFRGATVTWTPSAAGWNTVDWHYTALGSAKHRYYRLLLNNTPGAGPNVTEFQLLELASPAGSVPPGPFNDPNAPGLVCPGTAYIRPFFQARGGTATGYSVDCITELDIIEMPPGAGSTALL